MNLITLPAFKSHNLSKSRQYYNMSQCDVYYNEEYAPISDDYIAAEVRAAQLNQKKPSRKYKKVKRQRPKSRYDEDMYALPELEEETKQDNQKEPVTNPKCCQTKYNIITVCVLTSILMIIGGGIISSKNLLGQFQ